MLSSVALLAGGLGTRLRPITASIPKALVEVAGRPFIAHQLRLLRARGVTRVVVCAGHLGEMIMEFVGDGSRFGLHVEYSFDGPRLLGTAGALKAALPKLGEQFFVLYGDSYLDTDYLAVAAYFEQSGRAGLMTVFHNDGQWDRSNIVMQNGHIVLYDKRRDLPEMTHIDYGLGMLRAEALEQLSDSEPSDLADVYRDLLARRELAAYEVTQRFYEIGSVDGIADTERYILSREGGE